MVYGDDVEDVAKVKDWVAEMQGYRKDGMSWKKIEAAMGIWHADDQAKNREIDSKNKNPGSGDAEGEMDQLYEMLLKRYAEDKAKYLEEPEDLDIKEEALRIIEYVAEVKK